MRDRREDLVHLGLMLCGLVAMWQASGSDSVAFDPFSFQQDGLAVPEVDVGRDRVHPLLLIEVQDGLLLGLRDSGASGRA